MTEVRHSYDVTVTWTGNRGQGTTSYAGYGRAVGTQPSTRPANRSNVEVMACR